MALRKILQEPDDRLRKTSREVKEITKRIRVLIDDMKETLSAADGAGLAAPQVGVLRRIVIVDAGEGQIPMINPVILEREGEARGQEGCLSCEGRWGYVTRPERVKVEFTNEDGESVTMEGSGLFARAVCHEVDHLEGQLFIDIMDEEIFDMEVEEGAEEDYDNEE